MRTSELGGVALDCAVAKCEGLRLRPFKDGFVLNGRITKDQYEGDCETWAPSTEWSQAGPIIEREGITIIRCDDDYKRDSKGFTTNKRIPVWAAEAGGQHSSQTIYGSQGDDWGNVYSIDEPSCFYGETPLIAAMRCYVANKLGDEVEVPQEFTNELR
jgi:hypothetical protein